jgi:hypothetical protein
MITTKLQTGISRSDKKFMKTGLGERQARDGISPFLNVISAIQEVNCRILQAMQWILETHPLKSERIRGLIVVSEREIAFFAERLGAEEDAADVRMLRLDVFAQATRGLSYFERGDLRVEAQLDRE